ncbi:hypothetical protein [Leifsonia aquatica]|uniref:hypothetical protein n=1 Tax=Leifsonia aquatica TaxID=144185 RepID=UPI00046A5A07|nr:hypothetical protein [Leifsonia aquatica]
MTTLDHKPGRKGRKGYSRVREALLQDAGVNLTADEVSVVVELARERSALDALSAAMTRIGFLSPATARAAQAGENAVKAVEDEFGLLSSVEVANLLGSSSSAESKRSLAKDMRDQGRLLYVRRLNKFLYPGFQFDTARGRVAPLVADLMALAVDSGWAAEDVVLWLCSPTTYFADGSRPVDHFVADPARVLEVARRAWNVEW